MTDLSRESRVTQTTERVMTDLSGEIHVTQTTEKSVRDLSGESHFFSSLVITAYMSPNPVVPRPMLQPGDSLDSQVLVGLTSVGY